MKLWHLLAAVAVYELFIKAKPPAVPPVPQGYRFDDSAYNPDHQGMGPLL